MWMPIETGLMEPQKRILLYNGRRVYEGYWGAARYNRSTRKYEDAYVSSPYSGDTKPTHWMPLPPPPNNATVADSGEE